MIYKGYRVIEGSTDKINNLMSAPDFNDQFVTNEYLVINNLDDGSTKEMRYDGNMFVPLRLPPGKVIKAKNALQRCALDLLNNPDITIVVLMGTAGSGKSYLCMQMARYSVLEKGTQSKILCVRSPVSHGKQLGYLKGSFDDKLAPFLLPFWQQFEGGDFEYDHLKNDGMLETNIIFYMKGTTYSNTTMIIDEAEDLKPEEITLVGTRVGAGSRIIFDGDVKQSVFDRSSDNAMVQMCEKLKGNKLFGCVCLEDDVRSETSKLFTDLF